MDCRLCHIGGHRGNGEHGQSNWHHLGGCERWIISGAHDGRNIGGDGRILAGVVAFDFCRKLFVGLGSKFMLISKPQLVVDFVMRLLMIENPRSRPSVNATSENTKKSGDFSNRKASSGGETSAVDDCHERTNLLPPRIREVKEQKGIHFYICLFRHPRFVTAQYSYMLFSLLLTSLEATLPLHVQDVFGWGSFGAGMMFLGVQAPGILLSPIVGWLRDRVGTRHPTWIAFALLAPNMWLLGTPGDTRFPWAMGQRGRAVFTTSVICIGAFSNLLNGVGLMESKRKLVVFKSSLLFLLPCFPYLWEVLKLTKIT